MSKAIRLLLISLSIVSGSLARADDLADVEAAVQLFYARLNASDPSFTELFLPGGDQFPRTGADLQSNTVDPAAIRRNFDAGLNFDLRVEGLQVKVYGDTAIATYHTTGATEYPDGRLVDGVFRASLVAVRDGAMWKFAHLHLSSLQGGP